MAQGGGRKARILVVDDEPVNIQLFSRMLVVPPGRRRKAMVTVPSSKVGVYGKSCATGALSPRLAHALNNHLTTVLGFAQLALETLGDHPAAADVREVLMAGEAGRRLIEEFVGDGLAPARPQAGGDRREEATLS